LPRLTVEAAGNGGRRVVTAPDGNGRAVPPPPLEQRYLDLAIDRNGSCPSSGQFLERALAYIRPDPGSERQQQMSGLRIAGAANLYEDGIPPRPPTLEPRRSSRRGHESDRYDSFGGVRDPTPSRSARRVSPVRRAGPTLDRDRQPREASPQLLDGEAIHGACPRRPVGGASAVNPQVDRASSQTPGAIATPKWHPAASGGNGGRSAARGCPRRPGSPPGRPGARLPPPRLTATPLPRPRPSPTDERRTAASRREVPRAGSRRSCRANRSRCQRPSTP
jgi:hypothetical protein